MPSLRARFLRLALRARRPFVAWEAPVESIRAVMGRGDRHFRPPREVAIRPEPAGPVPGEWLVPHGAPARPVFLYLHGGGWSLGWTGIYRRMVAHLALAAGVRAFATDYRLAPEHPFPAALEDSLAAYRWLVAGGVPPGEIVLGGDSAGGNLTLACLLALRAAGEPLPAAAVCISPATDLATPRPSFDADRDPLLSSKLARNMMRWYAGDRDLTDPRLSPSYGNLRGLPPLLVQAGGDELLRDDAEAFAARARAAGVDVTLAVWPGMWHVWHLFVPWLPEARRATEDVGAFVRRHLRLSESE
jgi:acetyl esterase/lipase